MRRVWIVCLLLGMFVLVVPSSAQEVPAWRAVIVYGTDIDMNLAVITDTGIQEVIPLPAQKIPWLTDDRLPMQVVVSPDLHHVVVTQLVLGEYPPEVPPSLVDTQTQSVNKDFFGDDVFNHTYFSMGAVSPDGTQFVISYGDYGNPEGGWVQIFDLSNGTALQQIHTELFMYLLNKWDDKGIYMLETGDGLGLSFGKLHVWNPLSDEMTRTDVHMDPLSSELLAGTGERVGLWHDENYADNPWSEENFGDVTSRPYDNVIKYYPVGSDEGSVILAGSPTLDHSYPAEQFEWKWNEFVPHWVLDGQAVLIGFDLAHTGLVYRDGTIWNFEPRTDRFLMGTPTGWLEQGKDGTLNQISVVDKELISTPIELPNTDGIGKIQVAEVPQLGSSVSEQTFSPYDPANRLTQAQCETFAMEYGKSYAYFGNPRGNLLLLRNPGDHNSITLETIGVKLEHPFHVLEGPVCVDGRGYWFVEYEGSRGWVYGVVSSENFEIRPMD